MTSDNEVTNETMTGRDRPEAACGEGSTWPISACHYEVAMTQSNHSVDPQNRGKHLSTSTDR
jgi:hypothetical protein